MSDYDIDYDIDPGLARRARARPGAREHRAQAIAARLRLANAIARLSELIVESLRDGGKVLFFGNGGSAADATHLAAEFVGRFAFDRGPMAALSLSDNVSSVTGIGNDYSYDQVFERQVHAFGAPGDVAIGLSTSGGSVNVLRGLEAARERGLITGAFTGERGDRMIALADIPLVVPSASTARIQEGYMLLGHVMCELVEQAMFAPVGAAA